MPVTGVHFESVPNWYQYSACWSFGCECIQFPNRHQFPANPMESGSGTFCIGKWFLVDGWRM